MVLGFCVICAGGLTILILTTLRSNEIFDQSIALVRGSPEAVELFGQPIEPGWMIGGTILDQGLTGEAEMLIPIRGPLRSGTVEVRAVKVNGEWFFTDVTLLDADRTLLAELYRSPVPAIRPNDAEALPPGGGRSGPQNP